MTPLGWLGFKTSAQTEFIVTFSLLTPWMQVKRIYIVHVYLPLSFIKAFNFCYLRTHQTRVSLSTTCIKDTIYSVKDECLFEQTINPVSITCLHFNYMPAVTRMCSYWCPAPAPHKENQIIMCDLYVQTLTSNLVESLNKNFFDWDWQFYLKNLLFWIIEIRNMGKIFTIK